MSPLCLRRLLAGSLALALVVFPGCSELKGYRYCEAPSPARIAKAPSTLAATGLFSDVRAGTLAEGVSTYRPRFELWSDGATKRRFVYLPPGSTIDTTDMDAWQFPEGTKLWKEFTRDGVRVETRYLYKFGKDASDWTAVSYVWSADGTDAVMTVAGLDNARGTPHDVPAARDCMGCHGGTASRVLGFSAVQLSALSDPNAPEAPGEMSLARLTREHRLSRPPEHPIELPGDSKTQQALGYLHANCGHCHNQKRPPSTGARCFDPRQDFDLSLRTDKLASVADTPVYRTAVGRIVTPGDPKESTLYQRLDGSVPFAPRMPALGTETPDAAGIAAVRAWIAGSSPTVAR